MRKAIIIPITVAFFFLFLTTSFVLAQDDSEVNTTADAVVEDLIIDEEVSAEDLEISEPRILPDSPFYGLKKFWERAQETFTFGPVAKAELQLKRANQRIIEAKLLAEKTGNNEAFDKVLENYETRIENIKDRIDQLSETHADQVGRLMDKFTENQIRHRRIFEKLEEIKPERAERVADVKEKALEKLGEVLSMVDNEKAQARITSAMERIEGSSLKEFKNLEILKALAEKVPEQARDAIIRAQQNAQKRLGEDLENIPMAERAEKFERYIENVRGDSILHLEIIKEFGESSDAPTEIRSRIRIIKSDAIERLEIRLKTEGGQIIERVRIRIEENPDIRMEILLNRPTLINQIENAQPVQITDSPGDVCTCIEIYSPVCGANDRTFGNSCKARCAGVRVAYNGECRDDDSAGNNDFDKGMDAIDDMNGGATDDSTMIRRIFRR